MQKMAAEKEQRSTSPREQKTIVRLQNNELLSSRAITKKSNGIKGVQSTSQSGVGLVANPNESDFTQVVIDTKHLGQSEVEQLPSRCLQSRMLMAERS